MSAHRIEVAYKIPDMRAKVLRDELTGFGFNVQDVALVDVYTISANLSNEEMNACGELFANPVTQSFTVDVPNAPAPQEFNWVVEIGFLPGVTDNVGNTARECVEDLLGRKLGEGEGVYSSQQVFLKGTLSKKDVQNIADSQYNSLIQRAGIKSRAEFQRDNGMGVVVPKVHLQAHASVDVVDLNVGDEELVAIGKHGIRESPESEERRGPLALDLESMKVILDYFMHVEKRTPTDLELESLAQTWSEHCKHTIFAAELDEFKDGLYKELIKAATERVRREKCEKGSRDFCVSVFSDNSGAIVFDDDWLVTDKVETHNSPSALDPFGGSITGIVGVNRDAIGFGKGAKPIANRYGFCLADPKDTSPLYREKGRKNALLSPLRIMKGVVRGVNVGGNCSGIPTPQGFLYFDERYKGKPLVFVGTIGLIPRRINGEPGWEKKALPGDAIVMIGGRVGQDGIHGATFSSEALTSGSPATAVQIGDPITQKKLSDAVVKEARDLSLYHSITDNGAGGLSCSIAEMARECNGCTVELDKVPVKYPGMPPWKIWVSESQERMTLAVPEEKVKEFLRLMERRGVEATVIGEFTDSGRCVVKYAGKTVMDVDLEFLHNGVPKKHLISTYTPAVHEEPVLPHEGSSSDLTQSLLDMLARLNICSKEFVSTQFDHEVQGGSVLKPLAGPGRVNADATVVRPVLSSNKGVVLSHAVFPSYGDIDTYHMAACAIDAAIRNAVAVGGSLDALALLDNFCWCSSNEPERLGQLKRAVQACYDYAVAFGTPFISGKDSMFNDFKGFDAEGNAIKISVPPTLLISSLGIIADTSKCVSMDAKHAGDLVYVLGETRSELGGSEYYAYLGETQGGKYIGNGVPKVDAGKAVKLYRALEKAIEGSLVASACSVLLGGLGVALAKIAIAGELGMHLGLRGLPGLSGEQRRLDEVALYSESPSRFVVTIDPAKKEAFEKTMVGNAFKKIGCVTEEKRFVVLGFDGSKVVDVALLDLEESYKKTLRCY